MIFVEYLPSVETKGSSRRSMAKFRCPVCDRIFTKALSNGERNRTCGSKDCKDFIRHTEGTSNSIEVEQLNTKGEVIREYPSMSHASDMMEVTKTAVCKAVTNGTKCKGFLWRKKK